MAYYQDHKITPRPAEYPILTDTVKIQKTLHLQQVAEVLGMPIDQIRDLNPQFRRDIVPYSEDPFTLRLPVEQALRFAEKEAQIYNYKDSIFFKQNYSHTNQAIVAQYDEPDTKGKTRINYAIRSGDNLGSIARKYGVNIRDIRLWNNIHKNSIRVGKKIAIYLSESQAQAARSSKQKQNAVQSASVDEAPSYAAQASVSKEPGYVYYQIRNGENLWVISKKFPGISDKDLMAINRFNRADVRNLKGGQWIKIKKSI
jgi:membrane-bound lytic murein transglycosylase D